MDMNQTGAPSVHESKCPCPHHKAIPVLVIIFGVVALLGTLGAVNMYAVMVTLPIIVIVAGVLHLFSDKCKCC